MAQNKKQQKHLVRKLLHKYRLVVLNEDTFEEKLSFKLNRLNVFVFLMLLALILVAVTTFIIAFTPLREYIPGYSSTALKRQATELNYKTDSLQRVIENNERFFASIKKVLAGDVAADDISNDTIFMGQTPDTTAVDLRPSAADSLLRAEVAMEAKYNLFEDATDPALNALFPPIQGTLSNPYSIAGKHYAVDITAPENTAVKAVADGTVIFAEWTLQTGYVLIIEHPNNLVSAYKHNASISKQQGDLVKAGEVIAAIGNTGALSTGVHLHFELWSNGYPVNPVHFIDFE